MIKFVTIKKPGPVKICLDCHSFLHTRIRVCPECGYVFYESTKGEFKSTPVAEDDAEFFDQCDREGDQ